MPAVARAVTKANLDWITNEFKRRLGAPYVYGGVWSPISTRQGCDCSALAAHILNGALYGPSMTYQRIDPATRAWITTESWRPINVGQVGPFGTITVRRPQDIPATAVVKIALHHGPGGGMNSHMWLEANGYRMESAGSKGLATQPKALAIDNSYGNDWAYLPGPILGAGPTMPDLKEGSTGTSVARLQEGMKRVFPFYTPNVKISGVFDPATTAAVKEFQARSGLYVDGVVGPVTRAELARYGITLTGAGDDAQPGTPAPPLNPAPHPPQNTTDRVYYELMGMN